MKCRNQISLNLPLGLLSLQRRQRLRLRQRLIRGLETQRRQSGTSSAFREIEEVETERVNAELEEGTGDLIVPVEYKLVKNLGRNIEIEEAVRRLISELKAIEGELSFCPSGILRLEIDVPKKASVLKWMECQRKLLEDQLSFYFRPRDDSPVESTRSRQKTNQEIFCGIGHSWMWKGIEGSGPTKRLFEEINCFLSPSYPQIKIVGASRFDSGRIGGEEWRDFGSYLFFVPVLELSDHVQFCRLVCSIAWSSDLHDSVASIGTGPRNCTEAIRSAISLLQNIEPVKSTTTLVPSVERVSESSTPTRTQWTKILESVSDRLTEVLHDENLLGGIHSEAAIKEYLESGQRGLDDLLSAMEMITQVDSQSPTDISKVVLARRSDFTLKGTLDPLSVLHYLQDRDSNSFQYCLGLPTGKCFIGSTPERLYTRQGNQISSEAVAGTRPRGPRGNLEKDVRIGLELLSNPKDHVEFALVRDWLQDSLRSICSEVRVDVQKSVVRKESVQHLYGLMSGVLAESKSDLDLLTVLHPTPAVCGSPQREAMALIRETELFDRGYYAGPLGWISGAGAEFVVAIRSGLFSRNAPQSHSVSLFAGVGTVKASTAEAEWQELDLKIRNFCRLFSTRPFCFPNSNIKAASLAVEELSRLGINTFGVAPGSRSSPLVYAAASNPNCRVYPCIDERSLGFWSVGFGRATGKAAAVITSSGTAVGNLMPAVIEASLSGIPMMLLTADRPADLRSTRANQTIDQVKIFGDYVRYFHDLPPTWDTADRLRSLLTMIDSSARHSRTGPVHLNFQFDEPVSPIEQNVEADDDDAILSHWWTSSHPFTRNSSPFHFPSTLDLFEVLDCSRGLLVVGEVLSSEERIAALELIEYMKWPAVVDVLSGLQSCSVPGSHIVSCSDHLLNEDESLFEALRPEVILQLGGHITSKRFVKFLETSRHSHPDTRWILVAPSDQRDDPSHLVTHHVTLSIAQLSQAIHHGPITSFRKCDAFRDTWDAVLDAARLSGQQSMGSLGAREDLTEPYVSYLVSKMLPMATGLYLGNGMPIRDMNTFGGLDFDGLRAVGANRGASGIDGVVSSAIGFALGIGRPVTLLIGDISFLHDSNGLGLLRSEQWPPVTIVVINNRGGGIFDFLPIAKSVPADMFDALWSTPQYIDVAALSQAYGIAYNKASSPDELKTALGLAWNSNQHCIVEAKTNREENVLLHKWVLSLSSAAGLSALGLRKEANEGEVVGFEWKEFSIPLRQPVGGGDHVTSEIRNGILVDVTFRTESGFVKGTGEISPLSGLHVESLDECHRQLKFLRSLILGKKVPASVCLLKGKLSRWLIDNLGLKDCDLCPSVQFGVESSILTALGNIVEIYTGSKGEDVAINALLPSIPDVQTGIRQISDLLEMGYRVVKIKVGRNPDPVEEAQILSKICDHFGDRLIIRLDANRGWNLSQALDFASHLRCQSLEYIEEPVDDPLHLKEFRDKTSLPVALDETVIHCDRSEIASIIDSDVIEAIIIKPSRVGSIDRAVDLIRLGSSRGSKVVVTSSFESPIGIRFLKQLAMVADFEMNRTIGIASKSVNHGLGTVDWFDESGIESDTWIYPPLKPISTDSRQIKFKEVTTRHGGCSLAFREAGSDHSEALIFIHGAGRTSEDWIPIMEYLSVSFHCIAVDLPNHGHTSLRADGLLQFDEICDILKQFKYQCGVNSCHLVTFQLDGFMAQYLARCLGSEKLVVILGSAGIFETVKQLDMEIAFEAPAESTTKPSRRHTGHFGQLNSGSQIAEGARSFLRPRPAAERTISRPNLFALPGLQLLYLHAMRGTEDKNDALESTKHSVRLQSGSVFLSSGPRWCIVESALRIGLLIMSWL